MEYSKKYEVKSAEEKKLEIEKFFEEVKQEVKNYTVDSGSLKELLDWQQKFYNYSFGNSILIQQQFHGAEAVGSFKFWTDNGYSVNRGEKGIKILVPCKCSDYFLREEEKIPVQKATQEEHEKIKAGDIKVYPGSVYYKVGYVFDISQTNCPVADIPKLFPNRWLEGDIKDYNVFLDSVKKLANQMNVKILEEPKSELGAAKGVSYTGQNEIALNPRNSELQNAKTLIHELAHQKLHRVESKLTTPEKEFQAEMTAYTVCKHFGIDTGEYSLNYIHSWTKGHEDIMDTQKLLTEAAQASRYFIDVMATEPLMKQKEVEIVKNEIYDSKEVRQIDRMKNAKFHIFEKKESNKFFIGEKKENKVTQVSKIMTLANAKETLKQMNEVRQSSSVLKQKDLIEL